MISLIVLIERDEARDLEMMVRFHDCWHVLWNWGGVSGGNDDTIAGNLLIMAYEALHVGMGYESRINLVARRRNAKQGVIYNLI